MREITSHKVNGLNDQIKIEAVDEPGPGGANHHYSVTGFDTEDNPSKYTTANGYATSFSRLPVIFQNGPIPTEGVNGVSNEALLAIVEDRLKCFQAGPYACRENALVLTKIQEAMHWLHHRTRERVARGVEGTLAR